MNDILINMGLNIVITLLQSIKGPEKKKLFAKVFLKVNTLIAGIYKNDPEHPEFKATWD